MIMRITTKDLGKLLQKEVIKIGDITIKITNENESFVEQTTPKKAKDYVVSYNYVKLTQEEYEKLKKDFSNINIDKVIEGVENYVEMNANKNKYKNWYLVIRNAINNKWRLFDKNNNEVNYGVAIKSNKNTNYKSVKAVPDWYDEYSKMYSNESPDSLNGNNLNELNDFFNSKK